MASLFVLICGIAVFSAPDEHASAQFIQEVRALELPRIYEARNVEVGNILHPRSTTVIGNWIVPIGFLGLPLWYGIFGGLLPDAWPATVLTPFLVMIAALAWYGLQKKLLLSSRRALIATVLFLTLPAFWFYAARSLMPNVPFVSLLIIAFWLWEVRPLKERIRPWMHALLAGLVFGIAISFRIFELPWILILIAVYGYYNRRNVRPVEVLIMLGGVIVALLPILLMQQSLYDAVWTTGYTVQNVVEADMSVAIESIPATPLWERVSSLILPFGFHPRLMLRTVFQNVFLLMPLFTLFGFMGAGTVLFGKDRLFGRLRKFLLPLAVTAIWLFTVYGSWKITDNPDPRAITFANSYSRYWLPVYLLSIPFVVVGMEKLAEIMAPKKKMLAMNVLVALWVALGLFSVLRGDDGLLVSRERLQQFAEDRQVMLEHIPENATVITFYADKYIFPERSVAIGLTNPAVIEALPELVEMTPVYYFGITLPPEDIAFYEETVLSQLPTPHGIVPLVEIREQTLYHFAPTP